MCDKAYNGEHIGSKAIRRVIEYYKPLAVFSGHVHESRCVDKVGNTIVVNPGPVSMGFYSVAKLQDAHVDVVLKQV